MTGKKGLLLILCIGLWMLKYLMNLVDERNGGHPGSLISFTVIGLIPLSFPFFLVKDYIVDDATEARIALSLIPSPYLHDLTSPIPMYEDITTWASSPFHDDPADIRIKLPSDKEEDDDLPSMKYGNVDVFYLPPTTAFDPTYWNVPWNNSFSKYLHEEAMLTQQASVFNKVARVFSPRFRQMSGFGYLSSDRSNALKASNLAYDDVKRAFAHYLEHWNQGRAIFLAGHSQGAEYSLRLLRDFFREYKMKQKLIAAYIIGIPVYMDILEKIGMKPCENENDLHCVVAYQTYLKNANPNLFHFDPVDPTLVGIHKLCVNPLSWTRGEEWISKDLNRGAMHLIQYYQNVNFIHSGLFHLISQQKRLESAFHPLIPNFVGAQCLNGSLFVDESDIQTSQDYYSRILSVWKVGRFPARNMHAYDFNLMYGNLQYNAEQRVKAYFFSLK